MIRISIKRTIFRLSGFFTLAALFQSGLIATSVASADELNWAQKMFEKQSHDFGTVARAAETRYRFKVTNPYQQPVHIASVRTTCGCSAATPTQNTLASGEVAYIEVTMDTRRFTRRKDSNLIVTFDSPQYEEMRLPITAYIRTDVVVDPGSLEFGAVELGQVAERKVSVAYAGRDDWKIRDVETNNEFLSSKVVETSRGEGRVNYEVVVSLKPTAPAGPFRAQLALVTDDADSPRVPLLVEGLVEADITVSPNVVSLGTLVPGHAKTVNVVVRGKKPFAIMKIECNADEAGCFQVRLPDTSQKVHVLPLTVNPPNKPGKLSEVFTITIGGRAEPVTFTAYGKVSEPGT